MISCSFLTWTGSIVSKEDRLRQDNWMQAFPIAPPQKLTWEGWRGSCTPQDRWTWKDSTPWRERCSSHHREPSALTCKRSATPAPDATFSQSNVKSTNELGPSWRGGCAHQFPFPVIPILLQGHYYDFSSKIIFIYFSVIFQARSGYWVQLNCSKIRSETDPTSCQAGGVSVQTWQELVSFHFYFFTLWIFSFTF